MGESSYGSFSFSFCLKACTLFYPLLEPYYYVSPLQHIFPLLSKYRGPIMPSMPRFRYTDKNKEYAISKDKHKARHASR
jgi:hypothetical protein